MKKLLCEYLCIVICFTIVGCGGTREYRLLETQKVSIDSVLPGDAHLKVFATPKFQDNLGIYQYNLYLKEAIEKQYSTSLQSSFEKGIKDDVADTNIHVTSIDTSIFPIAGLIIDIRVFFKIEIFDKNMRKIKTLRIYGFGSAEDGNKALQKAIVNSFHQLVPTLEELFIRS